MERCTGRAQVDDVFARRLTGSTHIGERFARRMRLLAPAKINLHLRVAPVRPSDGFHPLVSWMVTVSLFDTLTIRRREDVATGIAFTCDEPSIAGDSSNLVVRAAEALSSLRSSHEGTAIALAKRIPAGGGLGGGSSDAARALLGLNQFWNLHRSIEHLGEIAATLGSDVPFFLHGASSICSGRGEFVHPIDPPGARFATLFLPKLSLSTRAVYAKFDDMRLGDSGFGGRQPDWQEWATLSAVALLPRLVNDLEAPAFALSHELRDLSDALEASLRRVIRMSGSGSTLFTLFDAHDEAESAAQLARDRHGIEAHAAELAPRISDDLEI